MARIKVPVADGTIALEHFDGETRVAYKVANGEISVDDAHVEAVLASVPGSELIPETPAKKKAPSPPETPA